MALLLLLLLLLYELATTGTPSTSAGSTRNVNLNEKFLACTTVHRAVRGTLTTVLLVPIQTVHSRINPTKTTNVTSTLVATVHKSTKSVLGRYCRTPQQK